MKKILIPIILILFSINGFAENQVKVVAWGTTDTGNQNKFLEDFGLKSGMGISKLSFENKQFSLNGYYLPNQNANLQFTFSISSKWRLTAEFNQYRKWWNTSAGHETTPGGYAVENWFPNTNSITPISDRDDLYTTRRGGLVKLDYLVTPLQKLTLGYRRLWRGGNQTPFMRGYTFIGGVPYSATAASIRNFDENGQEAILKGNFSFGHLTLDVGASLMSWDNGYTNTLGTFGESARIGLTEIRSDYSTDVFQAHARLGFVFDQGEVFGAFA